jgi:hypothetical protein
MFNVHMFNVHMFNVLRGKLSPVVPKTLNNDFHVWRICRDTSLLQAKNTYLVTWLIQLAQKGKLELGM